MSAATRPTPLDRIALLDPRRLAALAKLGIESAEDLLRHYPRRHEDRSSLLPLDRLRLGEEATVRGTVESLRQRRTRQGRSILEAVVTDGRGAIQAVWFNQPYLSEIIRPGAGIFLFGELKPPYSGKRRAALPQMVAPEFELEIEEEGDERREGGGPSIHLGRIVPIYPTTKGLTQRLLRRLVHAALESPLPQVEAEGAYAAAAPGSLPRRRALRDLHFPADAAALRSARDRLVREEYFRFATAILERRERFRSGGGVRFTITPELDQKIRSIFPFRFTADQDRAVEEIAGDLRGPRPMYRLLQGDVGTGKTAVALYALLSAVRNRRQGVLMAPTEVLAEQHHRTIAQLLAPHPGVHTALLTGSLPPAEKRRLQEAIGRGEFHLVVGTHALIQEAVRFPSLGLAVIDEQHRFGVRERSRLVAKGSPREGSSPEEAAPHLLVMTATPIPRSLCLTAYGDLDLSVLRERPPGRKAVRTHLVADRARPRAMEFIRKELAAGRQAYFVYPLIDESETLSVPAAVEAQRRLSREVFPEFSVGLIHGRLSPEEKSRALERFRSGEDRVLVATVVVEVGIDVPNATVLFLEDASRFGLAQLHQLRGRIGRGPHPSWCLVGIGGVKREARERFEAFARTEDGFRIAEEDLRLRGPGDFLGVRQAGWPHFALGNPILDQERFLEVRALAERFWAEPEHRQSFPEWREAWQGSEAAEKGEEPVLDRALGID